MSHSLEITIVCAAEEDEQIELIQEETSLKFTVLSNSTIFKIYYTEYGRNEFKASDYMGYIEKAEQLIKSFMSKKYGLPSHVSMTLFCDSSNDSVYNRVYSYERRKEESGMENRRKEVNQ